MYEKPPVTMNSPKLRENLPITCGRAAIAGGLRQ